MNRPPSFLLIAIAITVFYGSAAAQQVDEICGEFGHIATLDGPRLSAPFVYGRIRISGIDTNAKIPKVSVLYINRSQTPMRLVISKSGFYCFKISGGSGGTLIVEADGVEMARRDVSIFGSAQQREDFDLSFGNRELGSSNEVVSVKWPYQRTEKTSGLFQTAAEKEKSKDISGAISALKQLVAADPNDFIAWGYLATLYLGQGSLSESDAAFRKSLGLKVDYTPSWVNVGRLRMAQKQHEAAIQVFMHAAELDPTSAWTYQLLGEAYLQNRQGTLGAEALNKALELDPVGMAECHLNLAHLYQLAGAKNLASREYRLFLEKVPEHRDAGKFRKFIKDNPE
ncbi:MAG: tetratricopeptide repeat protein [Acidobacteria bacterium]|nr:tetratricopeptide repeat protein [Acidobacteriota bacterium]